MINVELTEEASLILDKETIDRKILRMAFEIYEENQDARELIMAGIRERGSILARVLKSRLEEISDIHVTFLEIQIDKFNPLNAVLTKDQDCNGKVVIMVDDVANSGRTLFYAMRPFLNCLPQKVQIAVLIDRMHKSFPISVDYTGYRLSTTLQENVKVQFRDQEISGAYLDE